VKFEVLLDYQLGVLEWPPPRRTCEVHTVAKKSKAERGAFCNTARPKVGATVLAVVQ
jgi:hypothetical protein